MDEDIKRTIAEEEDLEVGHFLVSEYIVRVVFTFTCVNVVSMQL